MSIKGLGHFTIRCTQQQLPMLRTFYADVLGLALGERPEFPFPGHWFYSGNKPIVHLYASAASDAEAALGSLDHIAFDADGIEEARTRLLRAGIPFHERPIPGYALHQVFMRDPTGIKLEQTFRVPSIATGEDARLSVNGVKLAFEATGSGPALLLLHGGAGSLRMFDRLVPRLAQWFRVIRYDQRDCGHSQTSPVPYDFDALADDAVAVLDALDEPRAHVFGTSFGGLLAQAVASRHPGRVDKLMLSSTWRLGVPFPAMNPRLADVLPADRTPGNLARAFFSETFVERNPDAANFFGQTAPVISETRAALLRQVSPSRSASIRAATLVVGGAEDRIVPFDQSRRLASEIKDAQLAQPLPHVGHVSAFEDPENLTHLLHAFCG